MKKKKYYLGRSHVKRFHWLREENRKKVPRMLREYYRMIMSLSMIEKREKLLVNSVSGAMAPATPEYGSKTAAIIQESLERRKAIKKAIFGYAPFHVLRSLLDNAPGK